MPSEGKEETWPCDTWSRENEMWKHETSTVDKLYINITCNEHNCMTKFVWVSGFQIPILYYTGILSCFSSPRLFWDCSTAEVNNAVCLMQFLILGWQILQFYLFIYLIFCCFGAVTSLSKAHHLLFVVVAGKGGPFGTYWWQTGWDTDLSIE